MKNKFAKKLFTGILALTVAVSTVLVPGAGTQALADTKGGTSSAAGENRLDMFDKHPSISKELKLRKENPSFIGFRGVGLKKYTTRLRSISHSAGDDGWKTAVYQIRFTRQWNPTNKEVAKLHENGVQNGGVSVVVLNKVNGMSYEPNGTADGVGVRIRYKYGNIVKYIDTRSEDEKWIKLPRTIDATVTITYREGNENIAIGAGSTGLSYVSGSMEKFRDGKLKYINSSFFRKVSCQRESDKRGNVVNDGKARRNPWMYFRSF